MNARSNPAAAALAAALVKAEAECDRLREALTAVVAILEQSNTNDLQWAISTIFEARRVARASLAKVER